MTYLGHRAERWGPPRASSPLHAAFLPASRLLIVGITPECAPASVTGTDRWSSPPSGSASSPASGCARRQSPSAAAQTRPSSRPAAGRGEKTPAALPRTPPGAEPAVLSCRRVTGRGRPPPPPPASTGGVRRRPPVLLTPSCTYISQAHAQIRTTVYLILFTKCVADISAEHHWRNTSLLYRQNYQSQAR